MTGLSVLSEAESLINGERQDVYGDALEAHTAIAGMWSAYLGTSVTPNDVCNMMIQLKTWRSKHGYHRDSYVDICGYAALAERVFGDPDKK
jgi:Domain of unknown function (DUF6378)